MNYVFWFASALALFFATLALQSASMNRSVFFLWLSGLSLSGVMFAIHSEFLAWAQAVVATISCGVLVLHALLSGNSTPMNNEGLRRKRISLVFVAVSLASGFLGVFWFSLIHDRAIPFFSSDLKTLGTQMTEGPFFLALIVIILGAFLMLIGGSVISRAENEGKQS